MSSWGAAGLISMEPTAHLDARYSQPGVDALPWATAVAGLQEAELFWLATVRPDGRPHVTPIVAVWHEGVAYFTTGGHERKAMNLSGNPECTLTTGCNRLNEGLDLVIEGEAVRQTDPGTLHSVADAYFAKYGEQWHFEVEGDSFAHHGGLAMVFAVAPRQVFGFGKGTFNQTRWSFAA